MRLLLLLALPSLAAEPARLSMTLAQAEAQAMARSPSLAAALADSRSAGAEADAARAGFLPRLSLDASYRYQAEVPSFAIAPGAPARPFGDHRTTTIGPTLNWTLWDEGALYRQWAAQKRRALSQDALARLARRQAALGARLAYFQVQLARERLALLDDSVSLADTQHADIAKRRRAGSASRLDDLFAHQEALRRRRDYLDAQSALGAAVSELLALTGGAEGLDAARAADARKPRAPADLPQPTLLVEVDALSVSTAALAAAAASPLDPAHPRLAAYEAMADAARLSARAAEAAGRPKLQLTARASYDYPNIPLLESVWQKTAGLSLSAPLLEFGRSKSEAGALRAQAAAAESRRAQAQDELVRDRAKSLERLASLETQAPILERSLAEADEVARLTYSAYQAGHSSLLEVQSANVRAVEARTERARADAEALIELAVLASLAPESP